MKKVIAFVLLLAMVSTLAITAMAKESESEVTQYGEAVKATTAPIIDGIIDDVWATATAYTIGIFTDGPEDTGVRATFKVMWDETNIYMLYEVPDTTPFYEHNDAHQKDGIEGKFDLQNLKTDAYEEEHQFRFTVFRDAAQEISFNEQSSSWDESALTTAVVDNGANGYIVELAINCAKFGFTLEEGIMIGMDAQVNDNAEDEGRTACLDWNDDSNQGWQNPAYLGNMTLIAAAAADEGGQGGGEEADAGVQEEVKASSTKTGDSAVILIVLAIAMAGAVAVTRKASKSRA